MDRDFDPGQSAGDDMTDDVSFTPKPVARPLAQRPDTPVPVQTQPSPWARMRAELETLCAGTEEDVYSDDEDEGRTIDPDWTDLEPGTASSSGTDSEEEFNESVVRCAITELPSTPQSWPQPPRGSIEAQLDMPMHSLQCPYRAPTEQHKEEDRQRRKTFPNLKCSRIMKHKKF